MRLSTQLMLALFAVVTVTVVTVGALAFLAGRQAAIDDALGRSASSTRLYAHRLEAAVEGMHADLVALRNGSAIESFVRDPGEAGRREALARDFTARLAATKSYLQLRLIGPEGDELVRVERLEAGGEPHRTPEGLLANKGHRDYFLATAVLKDGDLYTSPIDLNVEHGAIQRPLVPVIRAATPIVSRDGSLAGILVINLDLRPFISQVAVNVGPNARTLVVDGSGACVVEPARFDLETAESLGCRSDELAHISALRAAAPEQGVVDRDGDDEFGFAVAPVTAGPSSGVYAYLVTTEPLPSMLRAAANARRWILVDAGVIAVLALVAGTFFARSLARPLEGIAGAVAAFDGQGELRLPPGGGREIQRVKAAFLQMSREVRERVATRERDERRFRSMVEHSPVGKIVTSADGRIFLANQRAASMLGYSPEELVGTSVDRLVPARLSDRHPNERSSFVAAPTPRPMGAGRDLYALRKDGSELPVEIALNPLDTEDGVQVLATIVDISERKAALDLVSESLRQKETLLREIYHRVKNNLQVLTSLISLQLRRAPEGLPRAVLRECGSRIWAMALAHEMLYRSPDLDNVDCGVYFRELAHQVASVHSSDPNTIRVLCRAEGLALQMDQAIPMGLILNELLVNCLKHAFPEGRSGRVEIVAERRPDGRTEFSVRDDGVGIPEEVDAAAKSSLGLALVHSLAAQLGGRVDVKRDPGTTFVITF